MATELEKICNPIFQCLCNYWQLSCITNMVDIEKFKHDLIKLFVDAEKKADMDPALKKEFSWIEKPLVFFIDYIVKEGRFSFRENWMELARNYNELSGDEKFFDLLDETLKNPDYNNSIILFYIMMGLGFNGIYNFNNKYVEQCMQLCMEKAVTDFDIYSEHFTPEKKKKAFFMRKPKNYIRIAIIASAIFMVIGFIVNLAVFANTTSDYRQILKQTVSSSFRMISNPIQGDR